MYPGAYRIISGFLCLVVIIIMPYYIDGVSTSKWCDGYIDHRPGQGGAGMLGESVDVCAGEWVFSSKPIPYSEYEYLRWTVLIAGVVAGMSCYCAYKMNVIAGYFFLIGLVFNPIVRLSLTRAAWVLLDQISFVSFLILLLFLLQVDPYKMVAKEIN